MFVPSDQLARGSVQFVWRYCPIAWLFVLGPSTGLRSVSSSPRRDGWRRRSPTVCSFLSLNRWFGRGRQEHMGGVLARSVSAADTGHAG